MRRVAIAVLSTIAGLVGLLSFKTEATGTTASSSAAVGATGSGSVTSGSGTTSSGSSPGTASSSASAKASSGSSSGSSSKSSSKSSSNAGSKSSSKSATTTTKTVTGSVVETPYGPIQVRVTVTNGSVTSATAVQYPGNDPRSQQINAYAVPILEKNTVGATSANSVDMVSGATYTSDGYLQSLQSALDKAGL